MTVYLAGCVPERNETRSRETASGGHQEMAER
jgi:hypothetical protein